MVSRLDMLFFIVKSISLLLVNRKNLKLLRAKKYIFKDIDILFCILVIKDRNYHDLPQTLREFENFSTYTNHNRYDSFCLFVCFVLFFFSLGFLDDGIYLHQHRALIATLHMYKNIKI